MQPIGGSREDRRAQDDQAVVGHFGQQIIDASRDSLVFGVEKLVDRRADGDDHDTARRHVVDGRREPQPVLAQGLFQQGLAAVFDEGQPAPGDGLQGLAVDIVDEHAPAGIGEGQGQRQADVASAADDGNFGVPFAHGSPARAGVILNIRCMARWCADKPAPPGLSIDAELRSLGAAHRRRQGTMDEEASEPLARKGKVQPRVIGRETVLKTPWFEVVAKTLAGGHDEGPYYAVVPDDYVAILGLTPEGRILLVRQYRPVTETVTLELPCGLVDAGETPEAVARRELLEETGYRAETLELLGNLIPDAGRLGNRLWCFFAATTVPVRPLQPSEPELEALAMAPQDVARRLADGGFENAPVYAIFMLAQVKGRLILPSIK